MRASTLFALSAAILLGLGAVVFAKYSGWFDKTPVAETKKGPYKILVARGNLFEGTAVTADDVIVRNVREDELPEYMKNQSKLLPPVALAAHLRVLARSVRADQPLTLDDFADLALPKSMTGRLDPNMRAVNVTLAPDQAGGGLLQTDERVDVYLTADICSDPKCTSKVTRTAQIARGARIIVKRNNLWRVMAPVETKSATYTLETNPYRAALIEYAKAKGTLTLVPAPSAREVKGGKKGGFSDPTSEEYRDEDTRVTSILAGEITVGDEDLYRIFHVRLAPPGPPPLTVERIRGIEYAGKYSFPTADTMASSAEPPVIRGMDRVSPAGPFFEPPAKDKSCPTCGKK